MANAVGFASAHGLRPEANQIQAMAIHPSVPKPWTVRKGCFIELFEAKGLIDLFVEENWPARNTPAGEQRRQEYLERKHLNEKLLAGEPADRGAEDDGQNREDQQFPFESDLRDFLAANLHVLEPGLQLYRDDDKNGVEFPVDGGRIDVLAVDRGGAPVVIELKLSRGRNAAVGQILYYMGWVDENLNIGPSRGIIVAREIPEDLQLAVRRVMGVTLFQYRVSLTVEKVQDRGPAKGEQSGR